MKHAILFLSLFLFSIEARSEIISLATGYGRDRDEALINAKKDAIVQSTGEYINQRTILSNESLSSDYISVINGVVTNFDVIKEYDDKTKSVYIRCYIQEGRIKTALNKNEVKEIDRIALQQLYDNHQFQLEAVYDLFLDESLIYDVTVKSVEATAEGGNYCYALNIDIKRNKLWEKQLSLLHRKISEVFALRFGASELPYLKSSYIRLVDEENKIELNVANTFGLPSGSGKFFLLGGDQNYNMIHKICKPSQYSKFNFKFKLVGSDGASSYFAKIGYLQGERQPFDISKVRKMEEKYW